MKKTLLISSIFPPVIAGPAILLGNIFRYFASESYCVLMANPQSTGLRIDLESKLNGKYFYVNVPNERIRGPFSNLCEYFIVPLIVFKGIVIIITQRIDNILVVSRLGNFEIAAFLIHMVTRKPLFVYMLDLWEEFRIYSKLHHFIAKIFEKRILSSASTIFVMSEAMQEHYRKKYQIAAEVIPSPVDMRLYRTADAYTLKNDNSSIIVFTGVVYGAQLDAMLNLIEAIDLIVEKKVMLFVFSPESCDKLAQMGLKGSNVKICFASRKDIPSIQKGADILFLPYAFKAPYPDVIRVSIPSKLPEYLAAGKPILVHAPAYSYLSQYARSNDFAVVVDKPEPKELKEAIMQILDNDALRLKLVENAKVTVMKHDAADVAGRFLKCLTEN